jgi:hypothetical protein
MENKGYLTCARMQAPTSGVSKTISSSMTTPHTRCTLKMRPFRRHIFGTKELTLYFICTIVLNTMSDEDQEKRDSQVRIIIGQDMQGVFHKINVMHI